MFGRKSANAMSGKTARACDGCLCKRARWYCAADDAFLCQACDASVHSANQLARRHEKVRLQTSSSSPLSSKNITAVMNNTDVQSPPAWHRGFTRKARTPRHSSNNKAMSVQQNAKDVQEEKFLTHFHLVPEIGSEEEGHTVPDEDDEDRLLYRVPVFDPFAAELSHDMLASQETETAMGNEGGNNNMVLHGCTGHEGSLDLVDDFSGFLSSDVSLAEFSVDVENLLGFEEDSPDLNDLGLFDCKKEDDGTFCSEEKVKKVKDEEQEVEAITGCGHSDMTRGRPLNWNFSNDQSLAAGDEEEKEKVMMNSVAEKNDGCQKEMRRCISLRLNYEAVITAWASQGSPPWTTGSRPELHDDDCWPHCTGTCPKEVHHSCGDLRGHRVVRGGDGGREARVLRYKEKRRTRLFSKKIRYEVRKLNAEKRPRMKGRFVKRTSFMGASTFPFFNS